MANRLSEIDLDEVSLVDIPAVKRRFLIIKRQNTEVKMADELTLEEVEEKEVEKKLSNGDKEDKTSESVKVEETEKAGAKLSKETRAKIQSIVKELQSLIEGEVEEAKEVKKEEIDWSEVTEYIKAKVKELAK